MNCIFCQIVDKKFSSEFLFENKQLIVVNDIHPSAPVHMLVIPKAHIQSIIHLEDSNRELVSDMMYTAKDMAKKNGLIGYKLIINVGEKGGQVIPHLHLHILGGWTDKKSMNAVSHLV